MQILKKSNMKKYILIIIFCLIFYFAFSYTYHASIAVAFPIVPFFIGLFSIVCFENNKNATMLALISFIFILITHIPSLIKNTQELGRFYLVKIDYILLFIFFFGIFLVFLSYCNNNILRDVNKNDK